MNNFMIDQVTGQPIQEMQPQLNLATGMPVQQAAAQIPMPNQAVYGRQQPIQVAENIFGTQEERRLSVAMTQAQEDAFGPGGEVYESGNTKIYEGLKAKE